MKKTIETNDQNVPETEVNDQNDLTQERQIEESTPEQDQQLTTGTKPTGTSKGWDTNVLNLKRQGRI